MRAQIRFAWFRITRGAAIVALAWCTVLVHAGVMIAMAWRWAFQYEPYTAFGAGMLSALALGFVVAAAIVVRSLGRPAQTRASLDEEQPDALLLFPAEGSAENDFDLAPHSLATRRKALL